MGEPLLVRAVGVGRPYTEITQLGSNRVKVIRPLAGAPGLPPSTTGPPRAPGPARATFPGRASAAGPAPSNRAACADRGDADAGAAAVPASTRQAATQLGTPSAATSRRPLSATMARDRRFMFSSFVCVPNPRRDVQTVRMHLVMTIHGDVSVAAGLRRQPSGEAAGGLSSAASKGE